MTPSQRLDSLKTLRREPTKDYLVIPPEQFNWAIMVERRIKHEDYKKQFDQWECAVLVLLSFNAAYHGAFMEAVERRKTEGPDHYLKHLRTMEAVLNDAISDLKVQVDEDDKRAKAAELLHKETTRQTGLFRGGQRLLCSWGCLGL